MSEPAREQDCSRGAAGFRLRPHLQAPIKDDLLRDFAREALGAQRCSQQYLDALRTVLGNQAHAERHGYLLEMNLRVSFATERTMRAIIDQMRAAGVSFGKKVFLGNGRWQVVQCFARRKRSCSMAEAAEELERMYRIHEGETVCASASSIDPDSVPY